MVLASLRRKWFSWLLWIEVLAVIIFLQATMGDEGDMGIPSTGLLCVSNCATCPLICSPPPVFTSLPPPPPSPLEQYYSPPQSYYLPQPPPPPPPSYSYFPVAPPPPPPEQYYYSAPQSNYLNIPPFAPAPPTNGPHDYSYPYYFFYAFKGTCLSLPAFFSYFFISLLLYSPFW